mmetsp:Transcript_11821/g.28271  ORF Transcript_11821/g.28271 Transcript_11821/m.28271 type:complete len:623 (+) Transcript_11821:89-1957(+)
MSTPVRDVKSKRYHLIQTHGDSLVGSFEASPSSVLWGELFTEKERIFLRQCLEEGNISFGSEDTFQIEYRIAWNPAAKKQIETRGGTSEHNLVIFLHGYSGRITNSWGWVKMVKPLWKQGFTVCLLDMPGFGRSSVNMRWNAPLSSWQRHDSIILSKLIERMRFLKPISFVSYRESCQSVLRVFRDSPHLVSDRQVLIDPVFTWDHIYPMERPYGANNKEWLSQKAGKQFVEFDKFMSRGKIRIWTIFTGLPDADGGREALQAIMRTRQHLTMRICVSHVTQEFVCEARAGAVGASSYVHLLFLCRYIKDRLCGFLTGAEQAPKEIPPWALEVTSTTASSSIGSKSLPSVDSPVGKAKAFNALETVQEVAEVLSRCTTARQESRPQSAASVQEAELRGAPHQVEKSDKRLLSQNATPSLPTLALQQSSKGSQLAASSKGFTETFHLRETLRIDAASSKGFRDRGGMHALLKQNRSAAALGMSRYGTSFLNGGNQNQTRSEPRLQDIGQSEVSLAQGRLPKLARGRKASQASQPDHSAGVASRTEKMQPVIKKEANSITKCATKAVEQRTEDPRPARHRLLCPPKGAKQDVAATGYKYSPRGAQVKRSVKEVLEDLKGTIPNF